VSKNKFTKIYKFEQSVMSGFLKQIKSILKHRSGVDFINILWALFWGKQIEQFFLITFGFAIFWHQNISKKFARKMLMKLTQESKRFLCRKVHQELLSWKKWHYRIHKNKLDCLKSQYRNKVFCQKIVSILIINEFNKVKCS